MEKRATRKEAHRAYIGCQLNAQQSPKKGSSTWLTVYSAVAECEFFLCVLEENYMVGIVKPSSATPLSVNR